MTLKIDLSTAYLQGDARTLLLSGRAATNQLVRWCPRAKTWQPADEPTCNWEHGDIASHRLRLRQMRVCGTCEQAYVKKRDFEQHECFSAY